MNLLIVEDDMEINELLRSFLEGEGYSITSAYDGKTALELFQKDHFDLVLLDLMIPKINGISVMKRIRNSLDILTLDIICLEYLLRSQQMTFPSLHHKSTRLY